jgi:hypothetical protein
MRIRVFAWRIDLLIMAQRHQIPEITILFRESKCEIAVMLAKRVEDLRSQRGKTLE